jgi:hypothetical protein
MKSPKSAIGRFRIPRMLNPGFSCYTTEGRRPQFVKDRLFKY